MPEYPQILRAKEDAEARLRALPGVHAVGISHKVVQGRPTDELCIVVFLPEKKPLAQLAAAEVVPPEIDGVRTDVVEMAMPRLQAADLHRLRPALSTDAPRVTLSGEETPGAGLLVWLIFAEGLAGAPLGTPKTAVCETEATMSLHDIAVALADAAHGEHLAHCSVAALENQVVFTPAGPPMPGACAITRCVVTTVDDHRYSDYLRGGIQIELGGSTAAGTLGCLATTADGHVVGLTCHHVAAPPSASGTNLIVSIAPDDSTQIRFGIYGPEPIFPDTLVAVRLATARQGVYLTTLAGETVLGIAQRVASAITQLGIAGVSASASVPGGPGPGWPAIDLIGDTFALWGAYGPPATENGAALQATVAGLEITFQGAVPGPDYGIFTNVNLGGARATFGVYTNPRQGATPSAIATAVAQALNALPAAVRSGVTATASGARVTVGGAQEVECVVKQDRQVGQPDSSFGSTCFHCCSHRIGRLLDARIDVDTALVQIDAGQKYKPEIAEIGSVAGTYDVQPGDLHRLTLVKRGRTTGRTSGIVSAVNMGGAVVQPAGFHRQYSNAVFVTGDSDLPFSRPGDSGAAVCTDGRLAGILFGSSGTTSFVTPIGQVTAAFAALGLDFAPAPAAGHTPGEVRTVPAAMSGTSAASSAPAESMAPDIAAAAPAPSFLDRRLAQAEREIATTPAGSEIAATVRRHSAEAARLVRVDRRVAAAWRRSGGPRLLESVLRVLQRRDARLPEEIEGRPFAACLERIAHALARAGSPALAADLARHGPRLAGLAGLTYGQMIAALRCAGESDGM
jgi:hypothetical protein